MKIAHIAPLYESVPPRLYGGTERIVSYITEELVKSGHEVTLFASGDSKTSAHLVPAVDHSLRLNKQCEDMLALHLVQLKEVADRAHEFDIIHFHTDYLNFVFSEFQNVPHVTTLHGKLTIPELQQVYNTFPGHPVIAISNSQRKPLPQANFISTVYHGIPENLFFQGEGSGGYLAFLGRISPEKRCDRAIQMAIATQTPIRIAAKIDKADRDYFEKEIRHLFEHPLVSYIGEINEKQKQSFLGEAKALLFPIDWDEPFGIVLIEAMACGTPVIAWNKGSVPEIIENGKTGFIVDNMQDAVQSVSELDKLSRTQIRKEFNKRFTARRMTEDYLRVYLELIQNGSQVKNGGNQSNKFSRIIMH